MQKPNRTMLDACKDASLLLETTYKIHTLKTLNYYCNQL